jgi:hypothetical protein
MKAQSNGTAQPTTTPVPDAHVSEAQDQLHKALSLVKMFAELNHQTAMAGADEPLPVDPAISANVMDCVEDHLNAVGTHLAEIERSFHDLHLTEDTPCPKP